MQTNSSIDKLILGTVQFGLKYGINNQDKKLSKKAVVDILKYGFSNGINTLDTADAYGNASDLIGHFHKTQSQKFNIITKFKDGGEEFSIHQWVDNTLKKLKVTSLFGCMFHSINDYFSNPKLLNDLAFLNEKGLIQNIGVSIYTNRDFEKVIEDPLVKIIQLPYNLLDNAQQRGTLIQKAKDKGKIIHVRSVFLQGLFFMNCHQLPHKLAPLQSELEYLHQIAADCKISMETLALKYVIANPNIDGVLVGVDNLNQLASNIKSLEIDIPKDIITQIDCISTKHSALLNPVNWS